MTSLCKKQKLFRSEIDMKIAPFPLSACESVRSCIVDINRNGVKVSRYFYCRCTTEKMLRPASNKNAFIWLGILGLFAIGCYPIIIKPMIDPSDYKEIQKISRKGIDQESIQPGNMRVWSDPFQRRQ